MLTAVSIAIAMGVAACNISHDPYLPVGVQVDLDNLRDAHYMSLVGCGLAAINAITGLIGIRKRCRKLLNIYMVFTIITTLLTIATGCLYVVWRSRIHALIMVAPSCIGVLCAAWTYILRMRLKMTRHLIGV
ncbi:hypothetical protein K493DRAFT_315348 [Basidiobolus meristosporus CBS 931.73]|uniref:Uncharacterized protein n=1 Tax=Basidiobolus meristosporus CBS 931.73 TaxID=1314790 RepID=A0A1Y1Y9V3_9FUNG|nr:hypothetical protein K493DRAFT_315348 [Basidiobolus meristosporus CBS 931.73]|eukprot:ORX94733.1 hypothetical protein K493DRAFT_315348 [Basidiobolus meristosporus CBS 931.73]